MASTTCLILLWLYIFGCIAVEVIASDDELKANERTSGVVVPWCGSAWRRRKVWRTSLFRRPSCIQVDP